MPRFRTSRSGSTSSRTPNLFLGAIPTQQLRQYHANFVGLPPVEQLVVQQPDTFRYVRQEERLWEELHAGLITSGKLPDALGLRSSQAVQLLGGFKDSGAVERAWRHSLLPRWQGRLQPSPPHLAPDPAAPHAAADLAHNEAQRIRAYCSKQGLEALPEGGLWGEEEQRRQRQLCLQVAAEGSTACRLLWGSVQEGAALHALGQLFPHSWVEEVGLLAPCCCLPPGGVCWQWLRGQLPGGITGAELPALAASPDATISHALPLTWKAGGDESDPGSYHLKDWGPLSQPRTAWVPQLQLHCLAAATSSVLLLSRSAGQGVTLFRMFRHDPYLAYMLGILRQLHLDYAARGCAPPPDLFNSPSMQPQHDALVTATMELSGTAVMVASRPGPFNGGPGALTAAPGSSSAAFLEQ
ncbi:hypothetical protein QJQ45_016676 [Haematococcus lacustris]|nr:hypothetical protein QJQ45_016676 [Haematococcus lacustris]